MSERNIYALKDSMVQREESGNQTRSVSNGSTMVSGTGVCACLEYHDVGRQDEGG